MNTLPTLVLATDWNVSYENRSDEDGVVLHIFRIHDLPNRWGGVGAIERHLTYGLRFPTGDEARRYAWAAGFLKRYERKAA